MKVIISLVSETNEKKKGNIMNQELKVYIKNNIFPEYEKNDLGHNLEHIKYVINRSLKFANQIENINKDMVYTIAAYHDIAHHIDAKNHEKISSEILMSDKELKKYFSEDEINIMAEAVYDHRASLNGEPRNIYGKIISTADRNTIVENPLKRTYVYRLKHNQNETIETIIEKSRQHILEKFGKNGYAKEKIYFKDEDYTSILEKNEEEGRKKYD